MGRGDRKKVRWARNREKKKKDREKRKQQESASTKGGR
jgi:hypothetical protein